MKQLFTISLFAFGCLSISSAQVVQPITLNALIINGDTIPVIGLKQVEIYSLSIPPTRKAKKKLTRLIKNVKKVYPWARLAGIQLRKYDKMLVAAKNEKERRKIMKIAEKEINEKYGGDLKELTFSQGKILIKLIDRETGDCSFNLVQELRGNFTAFFYQAFARIWGYNLKIKYDPEGDDKQIETIVRMIERGQI
ncbi:MAG: DUF4294 domain-containing protein [Bacteroidetes bacterium]|nr:DUF4294 domain-containing protein [Bacteroidota bacterium]